jgi:hypothetical protein
MQQQAALVAAHSAYLSPMATMAAVQMQHMAAINANGLIATPITPSSGKACARQAGLSVNRVGQGNYGMGREEKGSHGVQERLRGQRMACLLPCALRLADWFFASVCVCYSALSLSLSPPQEPAPLLPLLPRLSLPSLLLWVSTATAQCPPSPLGSLPLMLCIPTGFTPIQVGLSACPRCQQTFKTSFSLLVAMTPLPSPASGFKVLSFALSS